MQSQGTSSEAAVRLDDALFLAAKGTLPPPLQPHPTPTRIGGGVVRLVCCRGGHCGVVSPPPKLLLCSFLCCCSLWAWGGGEEEGYVCSHSQWPL
jgi:hypothetical protein